MHYRWLQTNYKQQRWHTRARTTTWNQLQIHHAETMKHFYAGTSGLELVTSLVGGDFGGSGRPRSTRPPDGRTWTRKTQLLVSNYSSDINNIMSVSLPQSNIGCFAHRALKTDGALAKCSKWIVTKIFCNQHCTYVSRIHLTPFISS